MRPLMLSALVFLAACDLLPAAPAPVPRQGRPKPDPELRRFQGEWRATWRGQTTGWPAWSSGDFRAVVEGDRITCFGGLGARFEDLDATIRPDGGRRITIRTSRGVLTGTFVIDGNTITAHVAEPGTTAPSEFGKLEPGTELLILTRYPAK